MSKQMCINYKKEKKNLQWVFSLHARSLWRPETAYCCLAICNFFFLVQALETILKSQIPIRFSQFKETLFDVCVNITIVLILYGIPLVVNYLIITE